MGKKFWGIILSLAMVVSTVPATVFSSYADEFCTVKVNNSQYGCTMIFDENYNSLGQDNVSFTDDAVLYKVEAGSTVHVVSKSVYYDVKEVTLSSGTLSGDAVVVSNDMEVTTTYKKCNSEDNFKFNKNVYNGFKGLLYNHYYKNKENGKSRFDKMMFDYEKNMAKANNSENMMHLIGMDYIGDICKEILESNERDSLKGELIINYGELADLVKSGSFRNHNPDSPDWYAEMKGDMKIAYLSVLYLTLTMATNNSSFDGDDVIEGTRVTYDEYYKSIKSSDILGNAEVNIIEAFRLGTITDIESTMMGVWPVIKNEILHAVEIDDEDVFFNIMKSLTKITPEEEKEEQEKKHLIDTIDNLNSTISNNEDALKEYVETGLKGWKSNIVATLLSDSKVKITWNASEFATGYEVYAVNGEEYKLIGTVTEKDIVEFITDVVSNNYAIRPINGNAINSKVIGGEIPAKNIKTTLKKINLKSLKSIGNGKVSVALKNAPMATSYTIKYSNNGKSWKTTTIKKLKKVTLKGKKGKKLYIKARANSKLLGAKIVSPWTATKKITLR